jgi:hypothetical protein
MAQETTTNQIDYSTLNMVGLKVTRPLRRGVCWSLVFFIFATFVAIALRARISFFFGIGAPETAFWKL